MGGTFHLPGAASRYMDGTVRPNARAIALKRYSLEKCHPLFRCGANFWIRQARSREFTARGCRIAFALRENRATKTVPNVQIVGSYSDDL
jgi:hypothetical protein